MRAAWIALALASALTQVPAPALARTDSAPHVTVHSSDGAAGPAAAPRTAGARWRAPRVAASNRAVASGVEYSTWTTQSDPAREPMVVHLLDVDPAQARLDLITGSPLRQRLPLLAMTRDAGAVAGINGDFFDIGDTGAPLGSSRDQQLGVRTGRASGWNHAFWIDADGHARVGDLGVVGRIRQQPTLRISHVNAPTVMPDRIGVYTPAWGSTVGARVTDGRTTRVREVVIEHGRVVANRRTLSRGRAITGRVLIGRGRGAEQLASLRRGQRVGVTFWLTRAPRVVIGGSALLVQGGTRRVSDDTELHPRSAVGVDTDTGHLLLMTVDGRSESSGGATLVELADLMAAHGAEHALNLDGGGSSTMVGADETGTLTVLNAPSDGTQRRVPNGLGVFAR